MSPHGVALLCLVMVNAPLDPGTGGTAASADASGDQSNPCAGATDLRAPDPRCGEALDGRASPAEPSRPLKVARATLWVPRGLLWAVYWPVVETSAFVEAHHLVDWADAILTTDDGEIGVRPVATYNTSFLPTGGLRVFYRPLPGTVSEIAASFQTAGAGALLGDLRLRGPLSWGLSARVQASQRADRLFAGIGPHSKEDLEARGLGVARFAATDVSAELRWSRVVAGRLRLGLHGNVLHRDYRANGVRGGPSIATLFTTPTPACAGGRNTSNACVDPEQVPGFQTGLRLIHAGSALGWDGRDHDRGGSGVSVAVDTTFAYGVAGDPSRHIAVSGEVVAALGNFDRVFILRGRAATVQALGSAPVPFDELVSPAGAAGMRGFADGRFRGPSGAVATAEYRWFLASRLDASLFTDVGTVSQGPTLTDFGAARWFPDVGLGFRFYNSSGPPWKWPPLGGVELAYAPREGIRVLFALAPF